MHAQSLISVIPDAQDVLRLEPEELAGALLLSWNRSGVLTTNLLEDALTPQSVVRVGGVVPGSSGALVPEQACPARRLWKQPGKPGLSPSLAFT